MKIIFYFADLANIRGITFELEQDSVYLTVLFCKNKIQSFIQIL